MESFGVYMSFRQKNDRSFDFMQAARLIQNANFSGLTH